MNKPTKDALSVDTVKSASFTRRPDGLYRGVVYDRLTGIEFDMRELPRGRWNANDDQGRNYERRSLVKAVKAAIAANTDLSA